MLVHTIATYSGIADAVNSSDTELSAANVGHNIILPATFTGSDRQIYQNYQDAMCLVSTK